MVTNFNSKDLTSFGKYLLSKKRTNRIKAIHKEGDSISLEEKLREVYQADMQNWKEGLEKTAAELLNEFFNSSSDANKYLEASQQEDLEVSFTRWLNNQ